MTNFDLLNKGFQACVKNAGEHLAAARTLREAGHNNMAYNAAVLALEEIGKAVLLAMVARQKTGDAEEFVRPEWLEDHSKKLFWALWTISFGTSARTLEDFQRFPGIANDIHSRRLSAIYVDTQLGQQPAQVPTEDVDAMIALGEYRSEREKRSLFQEMNEEDAHDLEWFAGAADDPKLAGVIFGATSFDHLKAVAGNVRQWMRWLRSEITRLDEQNQQLAEEELKRVLPPESEGLEPKWSFRVRWYTPSHTIRGKVLGGWNKRSRFVKLYTAGKPNELIVEFLVPRKIPFDGLGGVALSVSTAFALALSVGTLGFFWWYLPMRTDELFERIRDLERDVALSADSPALNLLWGKRVLSEAELETTSRIYIYIQRLPQQHWAPYLSYLRGLTFIAKNDIHGRSEPAIFKSFYEAYTGLAKQYGEWDGSSPFLAAALKSLAMFDDRKVAIERELPRLVELGEAVSHERLVSGVTLRDAVVMKVCCDLYITRLAHEALGYRRLDRPPEPDGS